VCLILWCEMCSMCVERSRKEINLVCSWYPYQSRMIPIMMALLGKKSDQTISEVTVVLLNFESVMQHEEDVSGSSSVLMTTSD
jgi:hypothetical protein